MYYLVLFLGNNGHANAPNCYVIHTSTSSVLLRTNRTMQVILRLNIIMHRSQFKILRAIANAPRYVTNHTLHTDFNIPYVSDVIHERINKHHNKLEANPNPLSQPLLQPMNTRRLMFIGPCIIAIVEEWKTNLMSLAILFQLLCAQHVSDINISIFRSLRLCWWITTSVVLFCKDGCFSN